MCPLNWLDLYSRISLGIYVRESESELIRLKCANFPQQALDLTSVPSHFLARDNTQRECHGFI